MKHAAWGWEGLCPLKVWWDDRRMACGDEYWLKQRKGVASGDSGLETDRGRNRSRCEIGGQNSRRS